MFKFRNSAFEQSPQLHAIFRTMENAFLNCKADNLFSAIPLTDEPNQIIISIGKNALSLAVALYERLTHVVQQIFVFQTGGYEDKDEFEYYKKQFTINLVSHPIPTTDSFHKVEKIIAKLVSIENIGLIHFILTGGGSASFSIPEDEITQNQYIAIVEKALTENMDIYALNQIRIMIDGLKGGKFRNRLTHVSFISYILSDVVGDDLKIVASGPTIAGLHPSVHTVDWLETVGGLQKETIKILQDKLRLKERNDPKFLLLNRSIFAKQLFNGLTDLTYRVKIIDTELNVTTTVLAKTIIQSIRRSHSEDILIWMGESTLDQSWVNVRGKGGRLSALQLTLASLLAETNIHGWWVFLIATDGKDGQSPIPGYILNDEIANKINDVVISTTNTILEGNSGLLVAELGCGIDFSHTNLNLADLIIAVKDENIQ